MNSKLQKEIFNYLALKIRLAFAKSGIGIGKDHSSNVLSQDSAEDFFRAIEARVSKAYDEQHNVTFSNQKVRDDFSRQMLRSGNVKVQRPTTTTAGAAGRVKSRNAGE
jgi:hypothetical protein